MCSQRQHARPSFPTRPPPTPTNRSCGSWCKEHGDLPDECNCGVCGSFGGCSWTCDPSQSSPRRKLTPCPNHTHTHVHTLEAHEHGHDHGHAAGGTGTGTAGHTLLGQSIVQASTGGGGLQDSMSTWSLEVAADGAIQLVPSARPAVAGEESADTRPLRPLQPGQTAVNDGDWHTVDVTHYHCNGTVNLFLDGAMVSQARARLAPTLFQLARATTRDSTSGEPTTTTTTTTPSCPLPRCRRCQDTRDIAHLRVQVRVRVRLPCCGHVEAHKCSKKQLSLPVTPTRPPPAHTMPTDAAGAAAKGTAKAPNSAGTATDYQDLLVYRSAMNPDELDFLRAYERYKNTKQSKAAPAVANARSDACQHPRVLARGPMPRSRAINSMRGENACGLRAAVRRPCFTHVHAGHSNWLSLQGPTRRLCCSPAWRSTPRSTRRAPAPPRTVRRACRRLRTYHIRTAVAAREAGAALGTWRRNEAMHTVGET